jgi:SAM-dependent methyltransferase
MTSTPRIFDRRLVRRRAQRADPQSFLLDQVAEDLCERLSAVRRSFAVAVDLGSRGPQLSCALLERKLAGTVIRAVPAAALAGPGSLVADEEALPFRDGSLDLVVSSLSLQLVNDLPGALIQVRRALRADGLLLASLLGGRTLNELRESLAAAESETVGGAGLRVAPFADVRDLGQLLQRAGFALPVADSETLDVTYPSLHGLLADLRGMGFSNALAERSRRPLGRETIARAAAIYAERFPAGEGRVRATFEIVTLTGWAPHPGQQKPLKPGSAQTPLAEALTRRGSTRNSR